MMIQRLLIFLLVVVFFVGCGDDRTAREKFDELIKLGMSYDEVRDVMGTPEMVTSKGLFETDAVPIPGFAEPDTDFVIWEYWHKKKVGTAYLYIEFQGGRVSNKLVEEY